MTFKAIYGTGANLSPARTPGDGHRPAALGAWCSRPTAPSRRARARRPSSSRLPAPGGDRRRSRGDRRRGPGQWFAQVSFAYRAGWHGRLAARSAPTTTLPSGCSRTSPASPRARFVEYRAVLKDANGNLSATSSSPWSATRAGGGGGGGVGPVTQPANVSVPGSHNSEMGCSGDWQPDCAQAQLALDPKDQIWKGTLPLPPANYEYKAAINKSWDENYGAGGVSNGPNIPYTAPGTSVSFYYDHGTHYVTSSAQGPIITAPGSYQSELGCGGDWDPSCMRPWLQDPDGDGTFTWSGILSAGDFEFKVAHGLGWDENYGAGGTPNGDNMAVSVPKDGTVLTISYVLATHVATTKLSAAGSAPDLAQQKAIWVSQDLIAWPATAIPAGTDPALLRWRLHWSPTANLAVDAETLGGSSAELTRDAAGLPEAVVAAHPELKGYLALRLDSKTAKQADDILRGQVAVAMYDTTGSLLDATGVQLPLVLDDLYAGPAAKEKYGALASSNRPTFRVWAPTAQKVTLLTWPAGTPDSDPATAKRTTMNRDGRTGAWDVTTDASARGARYLYEVVVYAPTTRKIETNLVTDPAVGRPDPQLDPVGGHQPGRRRIHAVDLGDQPEPAAEAARRLHHLRAARSRLLDGRRDRPGGAPRVLPRVRRRRRRHEAPQGPGRGRPQHRAPAADLRHHVDPGGPYPAEDPRLQPRVVPAGQPTSSAPVSRPSPTPTPTTGATTRCTGAFQRARMPRRTRRPTAAAGSRSSGRWSVASTVTACGWSSTRCSTTPRRRDRLRSRSSTAWSPATTTGSTRRVPSTPRRAARTSPPSTRWRRS